jgi:hypothetical protein
VLTVLKSGSLKLLETSGPVQACNGIALPESSSGPLENRSNVSTFIVYSGIPECTINVDTKRDDDSIQFKHVTLTL